VFAQPFRAAEARGVRGLYVVAQGTWEEADVATKRFELRGSTTPLFESNVWRWNGPEKATLDSKARIGGEIHYLLGPLTLSGEAARLRWTRLDRASGAVDAMTAFASVFVTGEEKVIDNFGWRQPSPRRPVFGGDPAKNGAGAVELLARASTIRVDDSLFTVLEGARRTNEITFGISWTLAYAVRLQLNAVHTWVPNWAGDNGIVSGGSSEAGRRAIVPNESQIALRAIFRI
jgi:phosphate-selective porin